MAVKYDESSIKILGNAFLVSENNGISWFKEGSIKVDPKIACLYYAADRKYNFDIINDYLKKGYYVVIDRYVTSNMAHQGAKIEDPDERFELYKWIDKLEYWLLELPKADETVFLHVPYKYSKELMKNREVIDANEKDEDYQKRSIKTYLELASLYNWKLIECIKDDNLRTIEDISKEILDIIVK